MHSLKHLVELNRSFPILESPRVRYISKSFYNIFLPIGYFEIFLLDTDFSVVLLGRHGSVDEILAIFDIEKVQCVFLAQIT